MLTDTCKNAGSFLPMSDCFYILSGGITGDMAGVGVTQHRPGQLLHHLLHLSLTVQGGAGMVKVALP